MSRKHSTFAKCPLEVGAPEEESKETRAAAGSNPASDEEADPFDGHDPVRREALLAELRALTLGKLDKIEQLARLQTELLAGNQNQ